MSKLTDEQIKFFQRVHCVYPGTTRAIESAATEPLLQRIAELEQRNSDLHEDVQRFRKHAMNEKAARMELERQLEEARKHALEEAAKVCDVTPPQPFRPSIEAAHAIRALKGAKE